MFHVQLKLPTFFIEAFSEKLGEVYLGTIKSMSGHICFITVVL